MGQPPMIAPSILSADFAHLAAEVEAVAGADWVHVDVMDGHFVPNLTIGLPVVESLLRVTDLPLDCHLMIEDPDRWAVGYAEAGARNVTVHVEAAADPVRLAAELRAAGALAGLSIKPGTPIEPYLELLRHFDTLLVMSVEPGFGGQDFMPEVLDKVRVARRSVDAGHLRLLIEIDGGINEDTIVDAAEAGVDCFVAGSAVYGADDPAAAVAALRARAEAASATTPTTATAPPTRATETATAATPATPTTAARAATTSATPATTTAASQGDDRAADERRDRPR